LLIKARATRFYRFMSTGRTSPALFGCTIDSLDRGEDFVVKLRGGVQAAGLVCEAIAASLADYFGIAHPEPALIEIEEALASAVAGQEPGKGDIIMNSVGVSFGTRMLSNLITWPVDRQLAASQMEAAAEIFAFDTLIQNPDRGFGNPNLGSVGDRLMIFDHELAFSFLFSITNPPSPWEVSRQAFWTEHVFFHALRHKPIDLDNFFTALSSLPADFVDSLASELPSDWPSDTLGRIGSHLTSIAQHAAEFRSELVRLLI